MNKYQYRHFDRVSNSLCFEFSIFEKEQKFQSLREKFKEALYKFRKN